MKIIPKIGFCVIYHPFEENADNASEIFKKSKKLLEASTDLKVIPAKQLIMDSNTGIAVAKQFKEAKVDVICMKLATWSSDEPLLKMSEIFNVPFIFWTYSHMHSGSLCGGQQFNMVFKEQKKECIFVYNNNLKSLEKIANYAKIVALKDNLRQVRFGIIGNPTRGMTEVQYDQASVREIFGSEIYTISLDDFKLSVDNINERVATTFWEEIKEKVLKISVDDSEGINAVKNYLALDALIKSEKLRGVTIECYPTYMGEVCLGFSLLADEGIACACEADINSTILTYIMMNLSGGQVHNIDPLFLYDEDNSILGTHCGCGSFELANSKKNIELAHVRLANQGLCILFPSRPGKVTMANLVGKKGTYRMTVIEGEAVETSMVFPGNPIRINLPVAIEDYLEIIEEFGIGHHWIIAYGHIEKNLRQLARLLKINYIKI